MKLIQLQCTKALHSIRSLAHCRTASTITPLLPKATFTPSIQPNLGLPSHYGRNTYFRRLCSSVPNFNFKYEHMKFEKLHDSRHIFEEITQKLASRENYASEDKIHHFFYYSSSDNVNCHSIQATINQYANNIDRSRETTYYYSQFYMAFHFSRQHDAKTNAYLSYHCIYQQNVNLSIKKIFRCKIYVSTSIPCLILHLFLISMLQ